MATRDSLRAARWSPLACLRLFSLLTALVCATSAAWIHALYQWTRVEDRLVPRVRARGVDAHHDPHWRFDSVVLESFEPLERNGEASAFSLTVLLAATFMLLHARRRAPVEWARANVRVTDVPRAVPQVTMWPSAEERARRIEARFATGYALLIVGFLPAIWVGLSTLVSASSCGSGGRSVHVARLFPNIPGHVAWWSGSAVCFALIAIVIERTRRAIHRTTAL